MSRTLLNAVRIKVLNVKLHDMYTFAAIKSPRGGTHKAAPCVNM